MKEMMDAKSYRHYESNVGAIRWHCSVAMLTELTLMKEMMVDEAIIMKGMMGQFDGIHMCAAMCTKHSRWACLLP